MTRDHQLPVHVARAVADKTAGRRVLWVGRPDWTVALRWSLLIWLFAVPWTVFSVGWTVSAAAMIWGSPSDDMPSVMRTAIGIIFPLWGIPFVVVGLAMMGSPFWIARKAYNTAYVVMSDSLMTIVASPSGAKQIREMHRAQIHSTTLHEWRSGAGTVKINVGWKTDSDGDQVKDEEPWHGIPDAAKVERLVQGLIPSRNQAPA